MAHRNTPAFLLTIGVSRLKSDTYDRRYRKMKYLRAKNSVQECYSCSGTIARRHRNISASTMFVKYFDRYFAIHTMKCESRGGAETYLSDKRAPVMIGTPSETTKIDKNTESTRSLNWPQNELGTHILFVFHCRLSYYLN